MITRWITGCVALLVVSTGVIVGQSVARVDFSDEALLRQFLTDRAERTVNPERCAECHKSEFEVWEDTLHATQFDTLHRKDSAKEIYKKLGLRLVRRATETQTPACLQCHYTPAADGAVLRASIGVSCESCHGPARDWIGVHNNYEIAGVTFQEAARQETEAHRLQRIENSRANGQLRPSAVYDVAANCFGCHTVPNEELVNVGGHSTGGSFELVDRIEEIRHNFLQSFLTADGKTNAERPTEHKRILFVIGRALEVEFTLRGLAVATKEDQYLESLVDRFDAVADGLAEVLDQEPIPELQEIREILSGVSPKANNRGPLTAAADAVAEAAKRFVANHDGTQLASLDFLWDPDAPPPVAAALPPPPPAPVDPTPPPSGAVAVPPPPAGGAAMEPPTPPAGGAATEPPTPPGAVPPVAAPSTPAAATPATAAAPPRPSALQLPGQIQARPSWKPLPTHEFYSSVTCTGSCHKVQKKWWDEDPHAGAVTPFRDGGRRRQMEIATAYGLTGEQMNQTGQICMSCHGTATSRNPTALVRKGVGCQQCHGAGKDFRGEHEEWSRAQRLAAGMTDLKDAQIRAATCAGCHYITDPRLLAAGHASGDDFDIVDRTESLRHWGSEFDGQAVEIPEGALQSAHARVIADRGPVPQVTVVSAPPPSTRAPAATTPAAATPTSAAATTAAAAATSAAATPPPGGTTTPAAATPPPGGTTPPVATPRSPRGSATPPTGTAALPPTPAATGSAQTATPTTPQANRAPSVAAPPTQPVASVDEMLVEVKRRLEALYARLRGGGR